MNAVLDDLLAAAELVTIPTTWTLAADAAAAGIITPGVTQ